MLTKIKSFFIELGALGPILTFAVLAPGLGILVLTATHKNWLPSLNTGDLSSLIYFLPAAVLLAGLSLVPTHALSLIAGLLYGSMQGSFIALSSIILASIISFKVTGKLVGDKAINSLTQRPQAHAVYKELLTHNLQRTLIIISLIRLSPIMPFAGTNVLLAAAKVRLSEFIIASAIGLAPRVILVVIAGAGLSQLDFSQKSSKELFVVGIIATILSLIIIGRIAQKALSNFVNKSEVKL
ncbi:MAG: VTT domain-containing protein [Lentisphaerales bacterium]|nr:VTT domain-containing protein [Lentisphaerales bacterium]